MARIVLVHGAFNEFLGPHELKARWLPPLRDGLWHHGVEIASIEVDVCFYGDLFRREPNSEAAIRLQKSRAGIAESIMELAGAEVIAALGQAASNAAFDRMIDMVTIMATEPGLRERLRARADAVIRNDTRVIIAHSLGTLIMYAGLCNHPNWRVHTFVTLGSPLALPMIFENLEPPPEEGRGKWPGSVQRWVNIRAVGDKAAEISLKDKFGPHVEDPHRQRPPYARPRAIPQCSRHRGSCRCRTCGQ